MGAPHSYQLKSVFDRFDTFCDDLHLERVGKADDPFDDRKVFLVFKHALDKGLIDLEDIGAESLEVGQGRISGAKVIRERAKPWEAPRQRERYATG